MTGKGCYYGLAHFGMLGISSSISKQDQEELRWKEDPPFSSEADNLEVYGIYTRSRVSNRTQPFWYGQWLVVSVPSALSNTNNPCIGGCATFLLKLRRQQPELFFRQRVEGMLVISALYCDVWFVLEITEYQQPSPPLLTLYDRIYTI